MTLIVNGCNVYISLSANDNPHIVLPDGYSYQELLVTIASPTIWGLNGAQIQRGQRIKYPVINSKSPNYIDIMLTDPSVSASIRLTIEKFGQIPDPTYFNKAFEPILVTGSDGKEYNVIPSDQFK